MMSCQKMQDADKARQQHVDIYLLDRDMTGR